MSAPIEPPPSSWVLPDIAAMMSHQGDDFVAIGADLEPGTLLQAYRNGLFPMPHGHHEVGWWSPTVRGVLRLTDLRVSRSLRRARRNFEIRVDTAFDDVVEGCADPARDGAWIDDAIRAAYGELHELGWAHSVECWQDGRLVGGLYGVSLGGVFAGESMFHRARDASKVALVALVDLLGADGVDRLIDVQWATEHLMTLGVTELPRASYLALLPGLLELPQPKWRTRS